MKIVVLADVIDQQYAGVYVYSSNLIKNLLAIDPVNEYWFVHFRKNDFFKGLNEIIVPQSQIPGTKTYRKFFKLPKVINELKPDIVLELEHIAPWIFARTHGKKVVTIYDLTPVLYRQYHLFISWFSHLLLFPRLFKRSDGFLAISHSTKHDIENHYHPKAPIEVTHLASQLGAPTQPPKHSFFKEKNNQPYLLYTGTLEPRKNLEFLIDVFETLKEKKKIQHKLVLVGKQGWKFKKILSKIQNSKFATDIHVLGYVPKDDLAHFYQNAEVFLYPSLYEGFGLPVLEAMSLGCPVVASNTSSMPEVVGDGGLLCDPNCIDSWVDSIYSILANQNLRKQLVEKGLKRARTFTWEKTARTTLKFFERLHST